MKAPYPYLPIEGFTNCSERECRPLRGSCAFLIHFPGFRFAPLLQLTLQDRLWAELWARLRRLVYRATKLISHP